jgi:uncharacterized protein DUF1517
MSDATDVSVLRIAIADDAQKFVEDGIARLPAEHQARLREAGVLLRRVRDAWVMGGAVNEPVRAEHDSLQVFAAHVEQSAAQSTGAGGGDPVLLVSIIVVARGELVTVTDGGAAEELRRALEAAAYRDPRELVAVDVVAVPIDTIGAKAIHPELVPIASSLAGKVICASCGGPFPQGLVSCPHCGAPAP